MIGARSIHILYEGSGWEGGGVHSIPDTNHTSLEFFFISTEYHSRRTGAGSVEEAVEERISGHPGLGNGLRLFWRSEHPFLCE